MKHVAAFQPRLQTTGPSAEDWDRLPWLFDEPNRAPTRGRRSVMLLAVVFAISADALASYAAGRASQVGVPLSPEEGAASSGADRRALAQRMSPDLGWYFTRPNAPY